LSDKFHASDNFIYDARGRMTLDRGLNRTSVYGFFHNRPVRFVMGTTVYHILYDENLNRVAVVDEVSGSVLGGKAYVYESGQDAVREYRVDYYPWLLEGGASRLDEIC
jgi:hypothetical protein